MVRGAVRWGGAWLYRLVDAFLAFSFVRRLIASRCTIPVLVFFGFFVMNLGIGGPAYMSDEIGYLDKAAALSGSTVHLSTSWFGGYSFMVSPAFLVSSNPYFEWYGILVLNAAMWAGTAALLQYLVRFVRPKASERSVFLAVLGAMLYPSWLSMSGYAFATSGFVLVFMAALVCLVKSRLDDVKWLAAAAFFAGYLSWIHPLGFIFLALFSGLMLMKAVLARRWGPVAAMAGAAAVGLSYLGLVNPWFNHRMSGSVSNDTHYTDGLGGMLHAVLTPHYWLQTALLVAGLLFFTVVATFGLAAYGSLDGMRQLFNSEDSWRARLQDTRLVLLVLPLLSVLGVILLTAAQWGAMSQVRIDEWVYGRYTDMYLLPLIAFGLLSAWTKKQAMALALFALTTGVILNTATNTQNTLYGFNNKVNIQALWPMHLASVVHANHYWVWGLVGALGIAFCGLMGRGRSKVFLPLLLVPVVLTVASNYIYHSTITRQHASVSKLYTYIRDNYSAAQCIGFTPEADSNERFNLYAYYLHGYNIKKMTLEQWQRQQCTGPYLTYDSASAAQPSLQISGVEQKTNLYMITRTDLARSKQHPEESPLVSKSDVLRYAIIFK